MAVSDGLAVVGGEFVLSPIPPERIFVPEEFTSDEKLMADTAERFCRGEILPIQDRIDKQEDGLMPSLIRKAAELGLAGPDSPMDFGGLGLGKKMGARIQEMTSLNGSFAVSIGVQSGIAQLPIALFGNREQKEKYLPKLCSGEWVGCYALSEPNAGSDALSASTKAVLSADGAHYILNGTKAWITNAKWGDSFIVFAQVDGDKFSAFIVERTFPGVTVEREEHKLGMKGSSTARLSLDNAEIPVENLIYKVGKGHTVALNALNIGRYKLGAMALGPARECIRLAAVYAKERKQFGKPIAEFGLIQRKLAGMTTAYFAAESILYRTGALIDSAYAVVDPDSPTLADDNARATAEFSVECSLVKVLCSETQAYICDEAIQVLGGYGFTEEFDPARHHRDARVSRIYEGTNEINRLFGFARWLRNLGQEEESSRTRIVEALERELDKTAAADAESSRVDSVRLMTLHCALECAHHLQLAQEQEITADMTDLIGKLYAMETVVARARKAVADPKKGPVAAAIATVYTQAAYPQALELARGVLLSLGSDPAKLGPFTTDGRSDTLRLNRQIAQATLDADGYPF